MKTIVAGAVIFIGLSVVSCRKNHDVVSSEVKNDTAVNYAREIYLWYNNIPGTFNAHDFSDPDGVMHGIRAFS